MSSVIVVGIQWGDEGKGKIVDLLAEKAQHVVRAQGGNNAGHTIKIEQAEYRFHLIPSGILYPHLQCYIAGGTVIDPAVLTEEIRGLEQLGIAVKGRLWISPYAHVIMPYHQILDRAYEERKSGGSVGTTGRGIGPCYADKALRIGIQMGELVDWSLFEQRFAAAAEIKDVELEKIFQRPRLDRAAILQAYQEYSKTLAPYVSPFESSLQANLAQGAAVLFEGAHGTMLDTTFGTYPFVTSSPTLAAGVAAGVGVGPTRIGHTVGVVKAYTTRVGNGPFPTEIGKDEIAAFFDCEEAREIGTTTGRQRRIGWFDSVIARYTAGLNGVDSLAITKLDILDKLDAIKICIGYRYQGELLDFPPAVAGVLSEVEPVYEVLPGWKCSTKEALCWEDLPLNAQHYLKRISELCATPISIVSVGPERSKTLILKPLFATLDRTV